MHSEMNMYDVCGAPTYLMYTEGGMSVEWFTELLLSEDRESVEILAHYRLHWDEYDQWPAKCRKSLVKKPHTKYYGSDIWRQNEDRICTHYFVPLVNKWVPLSNPTHIFQWPDVGVDTEVYQNYGEKVEDEIWETNAASVMSNLEENGLLKMQGLQEKESVCTVPFLELQRAENPNPIEAKPAKLSRRGKRWTAEEESILRNKYNEGCSVTDIAEMLYRTPLAITCRLVFLGVVSCIEDVRSFKDPIPEKLLNYRPVNI